jgi:O-antigen ligase
LFGDPNDVCSLFVVGIVLTLAQLADLKKGGVRWLWLIPLGLFFLALSLTRSRGGFLGLLGGLAVFCLARFGWRRALALAAVGLPVIFLAVAGRTTDLSTASGTGQQRIQLWADGLLFFRGSPLFGIGTGQFSKHYGDDGLIAHNSYIQAFAEMGFLGGALFVGAFYLAVSLLARKTDPGDDPEREELERVRPYLLGAVAGYAVCLFSLSLNYLATTYLVLGMVTAHLRLTAPVELAPEAQPIPRFNFRLVQRLAGVGVMAVLGLYVFVRLFAQFA